MQGFFSSLFGLFLSPLGLLVLGALDSSMLFFLPAAIDTAVIVLSARDERLFWLYPIVAALGSLIGASVTYFIGRKIGEAGLERWIPHRRLKRIRRRIDRHGVIAMGMLAVIPPPFPLTPFILTSGALRLDKTKFFVAFGSVRLVRFGVESLLAILYGRHVLVWLKSGTFELVIGGLMILALVGTTVSIAGIIRKTR